MAIMSATLSIGSDSILDFLFIKVNLANIMAVATKNARGDLRRF